MTIFRFRSARRGKSVDIDAPVAMSTVFPGVCSAAAAAVCSSVAAFLPQLTALSPSHCTDAVGRSECSTTKDLH